MDIFWKSFQKILKLLNFQNANIQPKIPIKSLMEQKSPARRFRNFGYTSRGCSLFPKFRNNRKMLLHSPLEISRNSNRNFWSSIRRPCVPSRNEQSVKLSSTCDSVQSQGSCHFLFVSDPPSAWHFSCCCSSFSLLSLSSVTEISQTLPSPWTTGTTTATED